jgi:hypothetical protein
MKNKVMSKFDEILQESKEVLCKNNLRRDAQIEFLIRAKASLIKELRKIGQSFEEAKDNPDVQLCELKIEKIKDDERRSAKNLEAFRSKSQFSPPPNPRYVGGEVFYAIGSIPKPLQNTEEMNADKKQTSSTRQMVIFLLSLMYGTSEVPTEVNKTELANFIESLKKMDSTNIYKYVCNPISAKPESIKERNSRVNDIKSVISIFQSLKINRGRWKDIQEKIKMLEDEIRSIDGFKQEDNEEKRNNQ